jgi:hypothetical protein
VHRPHQSREQRPPLHEPGQTIDVTARIKALAKRNLAELTALVRTRLRRMRYRPALLEGFLTGTGLDLTPFSNAHH